jgi:adenosine deaminase
LSLKLCRRAGLPWPRFEFDYHLTPRYLTDINEKLIRSYENLHDFNI